MSILIKGMEMPIFKTELIVFPSGVVQVYDSRENYLGKAQAVSLPEDHGRLIDADALTAAYTPDSYDLNKMHITNEMYDASNLTVRGMKSIIKKAPTIIEAERGDG